MSGHFVGHFVEHFVGWTFVFRLGISLEISFVGHFVGHFVRDFAGVAFLGISLGILFDFLV